MTSSSTPPYAAMPATMDGAILLGTIRMAAVRRSKPKKAFMELMRSALEDLLRSRGVEVAGWNEAVAAPEHERSGRA